MKENKAEIRKHKNKEKRKVTFLWGRYYEILRENNLDFG